MKKRNLVLLVTFLMIFSFTCGVFSDEAKITIQGIVDKEMNITYDGEKQVLETSDGVTIYPVLINGSTYLPVRAVAEMTNLKVDWDGETRTVILNSGKTAKEKEKEQEEAIQSEWTFASALAPSKGYVENCPSASVIKGLYNAMNENQEMLKLEYTRVNEGEVQLNTNYIIVNKDVAKNMVFRIDDQLEVSGVNQDGMRESITRIPVSAEVQTIDVWTHSGGNKWYEPVTPKGVTGFKIVDAWGNVRFTN